MCPSAGCEGRPGRACAPGRCRCRRTAPPSASDRRSAGCRCGLGRGHPGRRRATSSGRQDSAGTGHSLPPAPSLGTCGTRCRVGPARPAGCRWRRRSGTGCPSGTTSAHRCGSAARSRGTARRHRSGGWREWPAAAGGAVLRPGSRGERGLPSGRRAKERAATRFDDIGAVTRVQWSSSRGVPAERFLLWAIVCNSGRMRP